MTGAQEPFFNKRSRSKVKFYHVTRYVDFHLTHLNRPPQGPRDVAELTISHIVFVTLYVNAGTWSLTHYS